MDIRRYLPVLINIGLFQLGWFVCVFGGNYVAVGVTLFVLVVHTWKLAKPNEWHFLLCVWLVGIVVDSLLLRIGVLQLADGSLLSPVWLMCLWLLFATTLKHSMDWLFQKPLWGAVLGSISGPLTYWAGVRMSDVSFGADTTLNIAAMMVAWALVLPLLYGIDRYVLNQCTASSGDT